MERDWKVEYNKVVALLKLNEKLTRNCLLCSFMSGLGYRPGNVITAPPERPHRYRLHVK